MTSLKYIRFVFLALGSCLASATIAQDATEDFASIYGDNELVSIATGSKQALAVAPAVATVITEEDIRATGVSDLDELLEIIPGLHVGRYINAYMPQYVLRGIFSEVNSQVLLLINGVPLTTLYAGNRGYAWAGMPVRNIARVEIIRGPGSAVYGADAYAGVINVIMKDYDTTKPEVGGRAGSFSTKEAWWLHRGAWKDLKISWGVEALKTRGHREKVQSDLQSTYDVAFGTFVSEAPGPVHLRKKSLETHLDVQYKAMQLKLAYQGRFDVGTGAGVASALDPRGNFTGKRYIADWIYNYLSMQSPWNVTAQVSYLNLLDALDLFLLPPGTLGGAFPEGVHGKPQTQEKHFRGNLSAFYTGFSNHRIRLGMGIVKGRLKPKERKNFNAVSAPLGTFRDVSDDPSLIFILPHKRMSRFVFLQDEWAILQKLDFTWGIRQDWYSDFGRTVNPRAALVWQATDKFTTKLLYGHAFRSPSFAEQYLINNPVAIGSSGLKPETIDTLELAGLSRLTKTLKLDVNVFAYRMKDILRFTGVGLLTAKNTGRQWGHGLESEFEWEATDTFKWLGNYAFQLSTDRTTRKDAGNAPHHQGYIRGEWAFKPKWMAVVQSNFIGRRFRVSGDTRSNLAGFGTIDANIRYGSQTDPWSVGVIVQNIFDKIGRVPTVSPGLIPGDLPLAGRAIFVEAEFRL